jgi:hypothetical protein
MGGGGSGAQLFRVDDGNFYVIKLIGNPQGTKILANESVVGKIAELLGAPCPPIRVIDVDEFMVKDLNSKLGTNFKAGPQFGSLYLATETRRVNPSNPELMRTTSNLSNLPAVIVLDTLTQNDDRKMEHILVSTDEKESRFWIVDHGHCLGVVQGWACLRSDNMTLRAPVYKELIEGNAPFGETLNKLREISNSMVEKILTAIPCSTWEVTEEEKRHLLAYVAEAGQKIPGLIHSSKALFPRWV